jgi:hypothetical protein
MLFVSLLSCGHSQYTADECRALAAPRAFVDRCMGGKVNGDYVGDLKCWPFSHQRLRGVLLTRGFEDGAFYPNAKTVEDAQKMKAAIWPENDPRGGRLPPVLERAQPGSPHAYLIEAEGQMSQCDAWFGHQAAYPREFIISRVYSAHELPLKAR